MKFVSRPMIQRNWYLPSSKKYFILESCFVCEICFIHVSFLTTSFGHHKVFDFCTFTCVSLLVLLYWPVITYWNTAFILDYNALVLKNPGYRSRGMGSIPGATRFSEK
jgi:hypothetical protein